MLDKEARNIQFLEFELNNQCQYAESHYWCPRNRLKTEPFVELKTSVIEKVISFFKQYDFSGSVYFSIYNEPLLDNRLMDLIRYTKKELPKCKIQIYTNGLLLDQNKANELRSAGLDVIRVSVYHAKPPEISGAQYCNRLFLAPDDQGYDGRIDIYDRMLNLNEPCYMPIQYYCINCHGDVMMCWDEWKGILNFGNLYKDSVEVTLTNPRRLNIIETLKNGNRRSIEVGCSGCDRPTWMCLQEYKDRLVL